MIFLQLHGETEREDGPFMRPLSVDTIALCGQREDGQLKGGIVRDTQPPIRAEAVEGRIFQSRSTTARRSAISSWLTRCSTSQRLASQALKLIVGTDDEDFGFLENAAHEVLPVGTF